MDIIFYILFSLSQFPHHKSPAHKSEVYLSAKKKWNGTIKMKREGTDGGTRKEKGGGRIDMEFHDAYGDI